MKMFMAKKNAPFMLAILAAFALYQCARADEPVTTIVGNISGPIPYPFKAKTLEGRVTEAMGQSKQGDLEPLLQLIGEFSFEPDKVLKLLRPYLDDPNLDVQFGLIEAAAYAPESNEALHILIRLLSIEDARDEAASTLYRNYTATQLIERGGPVLKSALLRSAVLNRNTTYAYLLLSCYKEDNAKIVQFLQRRRLTFKPYKVEAKPSREVIETIRRVTPLHLALTELGDTQALERVAQALAEGKPLNVLFLLRYLKFVHNQTVLAAAISQLQNKSVAQVYSSVDGKTRTEVRVCDKALPLLSARFTPPRKQPLSPPYPVLDYKRIYSDAELREASKKFSALLKTRA